MLKYWMLLLLLLLSACSSSTPVATPAAERTYFFPETGHTVQPPFSSFFEKPGKLDLLGYPITEAFADGGWQVQYFQFGRLEYHPENEPDYHITVGWLGEYLNRTTPPSEHDIHGVFADFYRTNGGSVQFGKPISRAFLFEGRLVQDFQSARFIWMPGEPATVLLEPIGETYFLQHHSINLLRPIEAPDDALVFFVGRPAPAPTTLHCKAIVERTTVPALYRVGIALKDEAGAPLRGYSTIAKIGTNQWLLPPTLKNGRAHLLISIPQNETRVSLTIKGSETPLCEGSFPPQ